MDSYATAESGRNDLKSCYPQLCEEWSYAQNGTLRPEDVPPTYSKKVWWHCEKGHEWLATVGERVRTGSGCPICSGRQVVRGINDLETLYPDLATEWHPTKNGVLHPGEVTSRTGRKVWWQCKKGHEWQASIRSRSVLAMGCPYCGNKKVLPGYNDLATLRPDVAAEWNTERNAPLTAQDVTAGANQKAWWRCKEGHEYLSMIRSRTGQNSGCPYCASKQLLKGFNDLETLYPILARQWHPTLNGDVKPSDVFPATNQKYWWVCEEGHVWKATPASRTLKNHGRGCPVCNGNSSRSTLYSE